MALNYEVVTDRGDSFAFSFTWYEPLVDEDDVPVLDPSGKLQPGEPVDLTGFISTLTVEQPAGGPLVYTTADDPLVLTHPSAGKVTINLPEEATQVTADYVLKTRNADATVRKTLLVGRIRVPQP